MRLLRFLLIGAALGIVAAIALAIYAFDYDSGAGPLTAEKTIMFKHGEKFEAMTSELAGQGVIDNPLLFQGIAFATGNARRFQAGEYRFTPGMTPHAIMVMIANGKVLQHKITIPEGLGVREIRQILQNEPALDGEFPANVSEGSLLPETYHFAYGFKRTDLVALMQKNMQATIAALWEKRKAALPYTTPQQAMIMASIIEKETGLPSERSHVASVFINRLNKGMKLQTDPTVVYGLEQAMGRSLGRPLTTIDLQTATPYNTYMIDGLPPTPICNPGKASIEAALNPSDADDLYFVATGTGGHHFAATLEEHNRNVAAYRSKMTVQ